MLTFSFTQALVIGAPFLTLVFYLLFRLSYRSGVFILSRYKFAFSRCSFLAYMVLVISYILVAWWSVHLGHRPWVYFLLLSLVVVYIAFANNQVKSRIKNVSLIFIIFLLLPMTILANNNFLDFGSDQGAHLMKGLEIVETGRWQPHAITSYYEPFPLLDFLLASIIIVTGFNPNAFVFLFPICSLLLALILFLLFKQITNSEKVGSLAPFVFLSIPPLSFLVMSSSNLSLIFAFISLYLVTKLIYNPSRAAVICLIFSVVVMVILHASGGVFLLSLVLPLVIYSIVSRNSSGIPHRFRFVFILTVTIMFTYWVFNQMVLLSVIGPTRDFFVTIVEYLSGLHSSPQEAARPYIEASAELTHIWFAWAVPPATVAGYLLHRFHGKVVNRDEKEHHDWKRKMAECGSIVGLMFLSTSFLLAFYGHYTYIITPTYALLFFVTILFLPRLLSSPNEFVKVITVSILAVSLLIGSSSPNWAPIENPNFPVRRRLYNQIVYTRGFGQNLPQNVTLILDSNAYLDIPESINVKITGSYRQTRSILLQFERGASINELAEDDSYIFIVRVERLVLNGGDAFNLVRSSGKFAMITPVHYLSEETSP